MGTVRSSETYRNLYQTTRLHRVLSIVTAVRTSNLKNTKSAKCTLSIQLQWVITRIITGKGVFMNYIEGKKKKDKDIPVTGRGGP
jgi:hypothetical protein